jgi:hypothetical protein
MQTSEFVLEGDTGLTKQAPAPKRILAWRDAAQKEPAEPKGVKLLAACLVCWSSTNPAKTPFVCFSAVSVVVLSSAWHDQPIADSSEPPSLDEVLAVSGRLQGVFAIAELVDCGRCHWRLLKHHNWEGRSDLGEQLAMH